MCIINEAVALKGDTKEQTVEFEKTTAYSVTL